MDILGKFIETAKETVKSGYYEVNAAAQQERISLKEKLRSQEFSLISEIKHASPAGVYSFDNIDVEATAKLFRDAGADAISVVVEPKIFKGNLKNVTTAKQAGLPVLFKDFVIDTQQIKTASELGADALLLIVKVADRLNLDLNNLIDDAHAYGLEVLLECYNVDEMQRALQTKADILGINNRDLQTLEVDVKRTEDIMRDSGTIDLPLISESGIKTREDALFVKQAGARGILVGTALWTAQDMHAKIRELRLGDSNEG
jgi:indole-3-glycerol phosphate synthase